MTRKNFVLAILAMALFMFVLVGCSSVPIDTTPTPDLSIVWTDDFDDGDMEGWGQDLNPGIFFFVEEGVLNSGPGRAGDIYHKSKVSTGTWSFDLFFPPDENSGMPYIEFCLSCGQDFDSGFGLSVLSMENVVVTIVRVKRGSPIYEDQVKLDGDLSGWNHFDVTRNAEGKSKVYLNGELILEYEDELTITSDVFYLNTQIIGPFFDNLVVRNQVIDI